MSPHSKIARWPIFLLVLAHGAVACPAWAEDQGLLTVAEKSNFQATSRHEEVVDYYRQHAQEFQLTDAVKWQDFLIDATETSRYPNREIARQSALAAANRARAGEDFLHLAEEFNPRDFRFTQGEGYGQKHGEIRPAEAEPILFSMRDDDVSVVEVPLGFHVLKLVKRDYAGPMPLDEKLQTQIRNKLRTEVGIREQKRFLNQLKRKAVIEYSTTVP